MTLRERIGRIDRWQHGLMFKVVMSCVIVVLAIATGVSYRVWQASHPPPMTDVNLIHKPPEIAKDAKLSVEEREEADAAKAQYEAALATAATINDILARKADPTVVWVGLGVTMALALTVVWLGVGLTCFVIAVLAALPLGVAWGIGIGQDGRAIDLLSKAVGAFDETPGWTRFVAGVGALSLSFFILMEVLKLALAGPWAITAIAKNVVSEALRMRVSIVLIVMLILGLTALPKVLDEASPLRYRVQTFLQYGTGATFWVIALLVLFLAVASVAFEQRDRIIWQTMTKPVAPWQYLLGKWLGVVGVAAVLLSVTAAGVFLFTGYLRNQPAGDEVQAYVAKDRAISEDRLVLETQVLAARISVKPEVPVLTPESEAAEVEKRVEKEKASNPLFQVSDEDRAKFASEIREEFRSRYFSLGPGETKVFAFSGLEDVKRLNRPMTLRYKVSIGADDPRGLARVSFQLPNFAPQVRTVPLGQALTIPISSGSIEIVHPQADKDGNLPIGAKDEAVLFLWVTNGDNEQRMRLPAGSAEWTNPDTMTIPPDGLEISFPVGGYESNFLRVMVVLWLKLAFLAMVGVWAATYLSFAVASLVAFGTFLIAESAGFLSTSLEYYSANDGKGNIDFVKVVIRWIAVPIAWVFKHYADLKPTVNLVDGRMMSWETVGIAMLVLGLLTGLLYLIAVGIFSKRELATYSGQ
jgi:ABC-type transport system involved in multi-copper enzyme maturation permease subunit